LDWTFQVYCTFLSLHLQHTHLLPPFAFVPFLHIPCAKEKLHTAMCAFPPPLLHFPPSSPTTHTRTQVDGPTWVTLHILQAGSTSLSILSTHGGNSCLPLLSSLLWDRFAHAPLGPAPPHAHRGYRLPVSMALAGHTWRHHADWDTHLSHRQALRRQTLGSLFAAHRTPDRARLGGVV